ncbi:MAG: hypothetical protein GXO45_03515, partial [Aquificae bacterium]|nr:hypothetical protein [Aquificota bacterium]
KPLQETTLNQPTALYTTAKFEMVGQVEDTFLVVYLNGDVYFIDQHVASERVNYEILLKKFRMGSIQSKKVKPIDVAVDRFTVEDKIDLLERAGFKVEILGDRVRITNIPVYTDREMAKRLFLDIVNSQTPLLETERALGEIACGLSTTAGEFLDQKEAEILLKQWLLTDNPNLCPHGRPIYYKIPLETIKRKVKRK